MTRPVLRRPRKHKTVKELQDLLNRIGALLDVDGDFGPGTERAVREAQEIAGFYKVHPASVCRPNARRLSPI